MQRHHMSRSAAVRTAQNVIARESVICVDVWVGVTIIVNTYSLGMSLTLTVMSAGISFWRLRTMRGARVTEI